MYGYGKMKFSKTEEVFFEMKGLIMSLVKFIAVISLVCMKYDNKKGTYLLI